MAERSDEIIIHRAVMKDNTGNGFAMPGDWRIRAAKFSSSLAHVLASTANVDVFKVPRRKLHVLRRPRGVEPCALSDYLSMFKSDLGSLVTVWSVGVDGLENQD